MTGYSREECAVGVPIEITLGQQAGDLLVDVDVSFTSAEGAELIVPAFQSGDGAIRVRFAAPHEGPFEYVTKSRTLGFDGTAGRIVARPYEGDNRLFRHGRLRSARNGRTLEHVDGEPFFWLGDCWWMGLGTRCRWPDEFTALVADRVNKGFSVVQVVVGPLPEFALTTEGIWHPQQANEGGWAWDRDWQRLNPQFFDRADDRLLHLVGAGIVPCIVGMWGYYLPIMGEERVRRHWRNLIARYSAYPVVFCAAGEVNLPTVRDQNREIWSAERNRQVVSWGEIAHEIRRTDPYKNPITAHPAHPDVRTCMPDSSGLDINMVQTAHWSYHPPSTAELDSIQEVLGMSQPVRLGFAGALELTADAVAKAPAMPVVNAEACFEGIHGSNWQDVQRFNYWAGMLTGLAGYTYGAQGLWQMSSTREPFSNTRANWGSGSWEEAMHYPGGRQVGLARRFLERFRWWELKPFAERSAGEARRLSSLAARIDGDATMHYLPSLAVEERLRGCRGLRIAVPSIGRLAHARFVDPRSLGEFGIGRVEAGPDGTWQPPEPPSREDWLLVTECEKQG